MLEWYSNNRIVINFIVDLIAIIGFITTIYAIYNIISYLKTRKLQNKMAEIQRDDQTFSILSHELEKYIGSGDHDYGIRLVLYKNYPYKLDKDGFRKYLFWYKLSKKHVPSGYISNTSIAIIEEISFCGDRIYYNDKTHKWFVDKPGKQSKKYRELPYDMMIYHIPFHNILGYRFESNDWTDRYEPVLFTKYQYNDWKLFRDDMIAVSRKQYGKFPSNQLALNKRKRIKQYKIFLNRAKTSYLHISQKFKKV